MTKAEVRAIKKRSGLGLRPFARAARVHVSTVCRWLNGDVRVTERREARLRRLGEHDRSKPKRQRAA